MFPMYVVEICWGQDLLTEIMRVKARKRRITKPLLLPVLWPIFTLSSQGSHAKRFRAVILVFWWLLITVEIQLWGFAIGLKRLSKGKKC